LPSSVVIFTKQTNSLV